MYGPVRTVVWQGSAGDRRPYADLTGKPETIGLKMRTADPGVVAERSPAMALFDLSSFTHTAPNCCYWRVPVPLPI